MLVPFARVTCKSNADCIIRFITFDSVAYVHMDVRIDEMFCGIFKFLLDMVLKFNPFGLHVVAFMKLPINTENPH